MLYHLHNPSMEAMTQHHSLKTEYGEVIGTDLVLVIIHFKETMVATCFSFLAILGWTCLAIVEVVRLELGPGIRCWKHWCAGLSSNVRHRGLTSFLYPPVPERPPNHHHLPPNMQGVGGHNMSFSPQMTASSCRHL